MSYKLDTELFLVRGKFRADSICSKAEVQHLLKTTDIKSLKIRKLTLDTLEPVDISYFRPKKLSPCCKIWNKICEEAKCQEQ